MASEVKVSLFVGVVGERGREKEQQRCLQAGRTDIELGSDGVHVCVCVEEVWSGGRRGGGGGGCNTLTIDWPGRAPTLSNCMLLSARIARRHASGQTTQKGVSAAKTAANILWTASDEIMI